jgi:hypothetical protein
LIRSGSFETGRTDTGFYEGQDEKKRIRREFFGEKQSREVKNVFLQFQSPLQ